MKSKYINRSRLLLSTLAMLISVLCAKGQDYRTCGSHNYQLIKAANDPEYLEHINKDHSEVMARLSASKKVADPDFIIRIPVVVHLIGDHVISTSQTRVAEQIAILNEDYRKIVGTNGDGDGVDTKIEFCLASFKPDGITPTSGITYHYDDPSDPYPSMWETGFPTE